MIKEINNNEITSQSYWEHYYQNNIVNHELNKSLGDIYDKYWTICVNERTKSVIEIGAFPGRYLAYVAKKFNLYPTGLDFQSDLTQIKRNLHASGVFSYELINEDFLKWETKKKYDLVLSFGFIEHFKNYNEVIAKHFQLLNKGSKVFFVIPNKRYLRKWYGLIADRENLKAHNLEVMSVDIFKRAAIQNNMEIEVLEYFGPFQYALHGDTPNTFRNLVYNSFRILFKKFNLNSLVVKYPSKIWSSSIICIMKKK